MNDEINKTTQKFWQKWSIAFRVLPIVGIVAILRYAIYVFDLELMELNALFTSLVAGTIFLIGFLISGVLSDYKESEKIPSELASILRSLLDDAYTIYKSKGSETALEFIEYQKTLLFSLNNWFYKKEKTSSLLNKISKMNDIIIDFEKDGIQPNFLIKIKTEQNNIRKTILRIDTIRDTDFVGSGYAIVEAMWIAIAFGLIIMKINPFYVSMFFTVIVMFLISYMFLLIKDLDNPFDYSVKGESGTEISLKPIRDFEIELNDFKV